MKEDGVDWNALVEQRLAEARRNRQAEKQAVEPPPGPEAAEKLVERIRAAEERRGPEPSPDQEAEPGPGPEGVPEASATGDSARGEAASAPVEKRHSALDPAPHSHHHHRHHGRRKLKQTIFYLALGILLIGGVLLVFWPEWKKFFRVVGPGDDVLIGGEVIIDPPGKATPGTEPDPKKPALPGPIRRIPLDKPAPNPLLSPRDPDPGTEPADPSAPVEEPGRPVPPEVHKKPPETRREVLLKPVTPEERKPPARTPGEKAPEPPKPPVPPGPEELSDPLRMPEMPKPPEPPRPPPLPWDNQRKGEVRPVEPHHSVG